MNNPSLDWNALRGQFPALSRWTYLNTATFGQLPVRAAAAVARHFEHRDELACADFIGWFDDFDRVRASIATLINCQASDLAFVPAASHALSLLLNGIDWRPGDRIVTLENEFPNNVYFPAMLARRGVEVVETTWERFEESITPNTRLFIASGLSYINGFRIPAAQAGRFLRQRGVLFYLDATQGLGPLRFDMGEIQPDVFAVHGYKWLLAPNGTGFCYVSPDARQWLQPAVVGWRSDRRWRQVDHLHHGEPEFADSAEKYEGGFLAPLSSTPWGRRWN